MKSLYKSLALKNQKRKKYFDNLARYGEEIKEVTQKILPDARVLIFGSAIGGRHRPDSDLDILIITKRTFSNIFEKTKIKLEILKHFPDSPFEIHIITPEEYKNWYSRFIKKDYLKV